MSVINDIYSLIYNKHEQKYKRNIGCDALNCLEVFYSVDHHLCTDWKEPSNIPRCELEPLPEDIFRVEKSVWAVSDIIGVFLDCSWHRTSYNHQLQGARRSCVSSHSVPVFTVSRNRLWAKLVLSSIVINVPFSILLMCTHPFLSVELLGPHSIPVTVWHILLMCST